MAKRLCSYGWKPQLPDHRDLKESYSVPTISASVDLRTGFPPVYDQGGKGTCTCNSTAANVDYERKRQGLPFISPSRMWLYYMVRKMEGTLGQDNGAEIRDVIKILATQGVPTEAHWSYDESKYNDAPPDSLAAEAVMHKALKYRSPYTDLANLKAGLQLGYPFVFGFTAYDSFEGDEIASTGVLAMPQPNEGVVGGHAVTCAGYDESKKAFLIRNSWGADWGIGGYFWMPYDYMANPDLTSDFWSIRLESAS